METRSSNPRARLRTIGHGETNLVRAERIRARLATGYVLGPSGVNASPIGNGLAAGGRIYSASCDMARYLRHPPMADPTSMVGAAATWPMFQHHYQSDSRLPGMGLGFFRHEASGHPLVSRRNIAGFNSSLLVAPDDGVGIFAFTNGSSQAMFWLSTSELDGLLRELLEIPDEVVRTDIRNIPRSGVTYAVGIQFSPVGDLRGRLMTGLGLSIHPPRSADDPPAHPDTAVYRSFPLHPDDDADPATSSGSTCPGSGCRPFASCSTLTTGMVRQQCTPISAASPSLSTEHLPEVRLRRAGRRQRSHRNGHHDYSSVAPRSPTRGG